MEIYLLLLVLLVREIRALVKETKDDKPSVGRKNNN